MKKRALSSAMLKELRDEFSEAPEEISFQDFGGGQKRKRELDKETERLRYEEDNLIRLSGKSNAKQARTAEQELDDLTQFDDLSVLTEGTKVN
jgi:U3 small nucleolar ribonucleoprotein protein LCP5